MKSENRYSIPFKGLKEGVHDFAFLIDKSFFEVHDHLEIPDGKVNVQVKMIKKTNFLELAIHLFGEMQVQCDRCLENFDLPIDYAGHLVVRFSETEKEQDEEVIFLHPDEYQVDLKHYLYECLSLSIPIRKVHPDLPDGNPGCNPDMLKKLDEYLIKD